MSSHGRVSSVPVYDISLVFTVCHEMDQWPPPVPGLSLNLPVMGVVLQVSVLARGRLPLCLHGPENVRQVGLLCFSDPYSFQNGQTRRKSCETESRGGEQQVGNPTPRCYQQVTPTFDLVSPGLPASSDSAAHHSPTGPLQVCPVLLLLLVWWLLPKGGTLGDPLM